MAFVPLHGYSPNSSRGDWCVVFWFSMVGFWRDGWLVGEVFDGFALGADLGHGFDAYLEVHFGVVFGD